MQTLLSYLKQSFSSALQQLLPAHATPEHVEITLSTQPQFGHYQCNSAMKLAKLTGQNPRDIASQWLGLIQNTNLAKHSQFTIAGPGFINIMLKADFIAEQVQQLLTNPNFGIPKQSKQRIIVDFSSPNTAKEMHVGHLRSTIIGDCLARVFEFLGHDVLRLNHIGDWGTAFGMLIAYLKEHHADVLEEASTTELTQLVSWYRAAKQQFDSDATFKQRAQAEVVALQQGDAAARQAWEIICAISRRGYQVIYDLLNIRIKERGESFYNPLLADLIADLTAKHIIAISDGARCIFIEGFNTREGTPLPFIVQKSDGGYNYAATDLAALRYRIEMDQAQRILYVVDAGQSVHFQMLFKAAERAGYLQPSETRVEHVPFGLVLGSNGKKFRTRSGETERLIDLLQEAIHCATERLLERGADLNDTTIKTTARILGINAVKYADLACQRVSDYVFSYERMLRFEGNTAAFLMYAYVRIISIKRKTGIASESILNHTTLELVESSEIELGVQLLRFPDVILQLAEDLLPHRLCEYLFNLAEKFNAFFRDCRVEGTPQQNSRLLLCEATGKVLQQGLQLLGLQTVERM